MITTLAAASNETDDLSEIDIETTPEGHGEDVLKKLRVRRWLIAAISLSIVAVAAYVAASALRQRQVTGPMSSGNFITPDKESTPVRIFVVGGAKKTDNSLTITGTVRARHELPIAFRVSGKVERRLIEVGQTVKADEVIYELDPEDFLLQVESSQADLQVAVADVQRAVAEEKRLAELIRTNAVSPSEYERSLAERDIAIGQRSAAERRLELAKNQLGYTKLVADADGIILSIEAEAGQVVSAGSKVATLAETDELEAVIDIPENRWPHTSDLKTQVRFWSMPDVIVQAKLRELSPIADPVTRTFRGRFTLISPPASVKLGMTASVDLSDGHGQTNNEYAIPASCLMKTGDDVFVWVLDEKANRVRRNVVTVSRYGDELAYVSSGLTSGTPIVSAGVQKLDENMPVRVWEVER